MLAVLRRSFRILSLLLYCTLIMLVAALSLLFTFGIWRKVKTGTFWAKIWSYGAAQLAGIKIKIHGNIPKDKGFLVVANHLGYLDIPALGSILPLRFAPKAEIRKWPFFGWLTALGAPVWIDRKNPRMSAQYATAFKETLEHGISMLVFPEGTSTDGKHGLLPFKSTAFAAALECQSPILPILLFYRGCDGGDGTESAWHDETPFAKHVWKVLGSAGTKIDIYILPEAQTSGVSDRKVLAAKMHDLMEEEYWKIEKIY